MVDGHLNNLEGSILVLWFKDFYIVVITHVSFIYQQKFDKKMSHQTPQNLRKVLRKSPASNPWAAIFKIADFF